MSTKVKQAESAAYTALGYSGRLLGQELLYWQGLEAGTTPFVQVVTGTMTITGGSIVDSTGEISFGDENLTTTGTLTASDLFRGTSAGEMVLSGGTSAILGAAIQLYGESHATKAGDVEVRISNAIELKLDQSASLWDFQANDITTTGDIIAGGMLNLGAPTELTIATGVITPTKSFHGVDTEADAASDDLDTITAGSDGDELTIYAVDGARTVVVKHNTGNVRLAAGADFSMADNLDILKLIFLGSVWRETSRSDNA